MQFIHSDKKMNLFLWNLIHFCVHAKEFYIQATEKNTFYEIIQIFRMEFPFFFFDWISKMVFE